MKTAVGFSRFCGSRENQSSYRGGGASSEPAEARAEFSPKEPRPDYEDLTHLLGGETRQLQIKSRGLVAFSFRLLGPGLDHEARARPAGISGAHPQLRGVRLRLVRRDHQLLVRGHPEGAQALLHRAGGGGEAVVLHPLQQLQHQRQPAGAVHL